MSDLDAAIRARLSAITERDYPEMQDMRDAVLAALDATDPAKHGDEIDCACLPCTHDRALDAICEKLRVAD